MEMKYENEYFQYKKNSIIEKIIYIIVPLRIVKYLLITNNHSYFHKHLNKAKKKITCFLYPNQPYFSRPLHFLMKISLEKFYSTACHSILTK